MIIDQLFETPQQCPECGGISFSDLILAEKKDACYHKVKASAKVWPSAYASGRLVQCRKKGAANYGNKSEGVAEGSLNEVTQGVEHSEWADNVRDAYPGVKIIKKRTEDGRHIKSQAILNGQLVGQYNMNTGVGTFKAPKQQGMAETRVGQVPMTLKPGETDDLEPEDFEGFRKLPEYLEGQKAQQKAGKDLIQQSPYTYQSDQDWAYRNGAFDARQAAVSADFAKRGPLTTEQGMAEGRFQDEYPEYGGKDKNKAMTYDRNVGMGYEGEPWSDSNFNWSGDNPNYADSTYEPDPVILQGPDGKQKAFSPGSPEVQGVYDREYGIQNKLGQITKAFQKGIDFNANRPKPYTNLATSDSTNDFSDPIKLGQYDVDFPEKTVDKFDAQSGQFTQQVIPSPNDPNAPVSRTVPATSKSQVDLTKFGINPDSSKSKSNLVAYNPVTVKPAVNKSASSSSIPAKPRPGSWQELAKLNNITDPRKLQAGTYIKTPDGETVYVNKGDTLSGLAQKMRPTGTSKRQGMKEDDGFDDILTFSDKRTTDQGGKTNQTYSSTTIAKNPTTGQQQSLASWDHTDPKTGKNYSGTNYIDPQGNADVQKNYKESQDQLDELDKKTVASWVRQQPERIKGDTGLSRTNFKKAKRLVDKSIPSAIAKYKDPGYGKQEKRMDEVSVPKKYREKAQVSQAMAQTNKFFGRDDPAAVAAADRTIANRTKGLARADARRRPYTAPPVDKEKQRQQLSDKYPNIDQLVRRAELRRDPQYDRADGQAYYDGRDAEQNYHKLKQIQRIIQGLNEETRQATVNTPVGDFTANITKDKSKNTVSGTMPVGGATLSATKDMTPGGAQSVSVDTNVAPNLNLSATRKSADYNKGQLAGTKSVSAKYTDTTGALGEPGQQHTATRTAGVGFGGASGARVGKNYVTKIDKTLADYMDEAKGINSIRNPYDLQPLEAGGGMGGGGGRTTSGPSPFGAKPGSREASIAQPNANTMTVKQGPNPDYVPPKTLQQKYDDLNKKLDQLPPAPPVKTPRPGRAAADKRQTDQAQAAELKDVVPLSPAERDRLRPVDANKVRQSEINKEPPDLSNVRPGRDYKQPSNWDDVRPGLDEQSRKKQPPEEKYGPEYDDMVARVKKLAGLGPMRTVYDPAKRVYRNVPTAQQPKK